MVTFGTTAKKTRGRNTHTNGTRNSASASTPLIKSGVLTRASIYAFEYSLYAGAGLLGAYLLSVSGEPWINAASYMVSPETPLPFLGMLLGIPVIGGLATKLVLSPVVGLGVALMVIFNICQLMALFVDIAKVKLPGAWEKRVKTLAIAGWGIEFCVAFLAHPPYQGGMAALMGDAPNWDAYYFVPGELVSMAIIMGSFELFVWMAITIIYVSSRWLKTQKKKIA